VTLQLPRAALERPSAVGFGAAAVVQADLPEGLTLGPGTSVLVAEEATQRAAFGRREVDPMEEELEIADAAPAVSQDTRKWFVLYPLSYNGVAVAKSSDVLAVIRLDGELLYQRKRNLPSEVNDTQPTITKEAAVAVAREDAGSTFAAGEPVISDPRLEVWVDPELKGHLAWAFSIVSSSLENPAGRQYWVSAVGEATVLHAENTIYHTHFGTASGLLWTGSPLGSTANRVLSDLTVNRTGAGGGSVVTASDGRYGYALGTGLATLQAKIAGPSCVVQDLAGPVLNVSQSGTPDGAVDLNFGASSPLEIAQVSAFHWTNEAYHFAQGVLAFQNLPTRVNINSSCNAFWDGSSINFFRAGASCPNTAYVDVVCHEYGHGIDHWLGGIVDGGYSEGFGDAVALLITRQPCVGRDFFGAGTCLRDATQVNLWPPAAGEGVHSIGKRYGQFTWQLVLELQKTYSVDESFAIAKRLILAAAAGNPSNIPDAVQLSFIADDNDGNLSNGSPHFKELAAAADSRKIPRPPDPVMGRLGFVWADNSTAASYTPSTTYSYNSSGGTITIERTGTGVYRVRFAGLGGHGKAGGHVQVTAYGAGSETAKVQSWNSSGADFIVNVRCFDRVGSPIDTRYTVFVRWP
jgi:hypothetical protein